MKSKKGYSLIEIAIGLAIIIIFLLCTGSLINAAFTNYRLILQRNEALDFAIREMEEILQSDYIELGEVGFTENNMDARIAIENVRDGSKVYDDKVFLVTVDITYSRTQKTTDKYNIKLQSLKVVK